MSIASPRRRPSGRGALMALVAAGLCAAPAAASETPRDRYEMDVACLAATGAAAGLPDAFAKERTDAATMHQLYVKRLQASAPAIGVAAPRAAREVGGYRQATLDGIRSRDPRTASREQADLVAQVKRCEALPVFEAIDRGRKK